MDIELVANGSKKTVAPVKSVKERLKDINCSDIKRACSEDAALFLLCLAEKVRIPGQVYPWRLQKNITPIVDNTTLSRVTTEPTYGSR